MKYIKTVLLVVAMVFFAGCAAQPTVVGTINPHSKFAKIKMGMHLNEVVNLVGIYTDTRFYQSNLDSYIPNPIPSMQGNGHFMDVYFKGQGILTFEGLQDQKLVKIIVDPKESGYQ